MNREGAILGSMTEVTEVIVSPDLNVAFAPSELVDPLRLTNDFSPVCVNDIHLRLERVGADALTC